MGKHVTLQKAACSVAEGTLIALGGNALHRSPIAFVKELIRQKKRGLSIIKTAGALDVDMLAAAKALKAVYAGYIGFEMLGLAPCYRKGVEAGDIAVYEHACASIIAGLRAGIAGVPFQPINGFAGSGLPELTGQVKNVACPFSGKEVAVVPALRPDVAVIHVHAADEKGNAWIKGAEFEDSLMVKAAKRVIVTAEQIISSEEWNVIPQIPGFLVDTVSLAEKGAAPGSCAPLYSIDEQAVRAYLKQPDSLLTEEKGDAAHVPL